MIKLKDLLKESLWSDRKFGEPLPTVKDYKEAYDKKNKKLTEANKSLPPFEIAKRMMKSKYWNKVGKGFQEKIIKKFRGRGVTPKALDKWLPDYIEGREISKLFEGKLSEKKFIPTITIEKYDKVISVEKFKSENDAKKYIRQMVKKYKLKKQKGFWGNPKTGIELTQNFG